MQQSSDEENVVTYIFFVLCVTEAQNRTLSSMFIMECLLPFYIVYIRFRDFVQACSLWVFLQRHELLSRSSSRRWYVTEKPSRSHNPNSLISLKFSNDPRM
jgi:hypothetical protein